MSDNPEAASERAAIQHMMRRLDGFARGLGFDEADTRRIIEKIAAEMPKQTDDERLDAARQRMVIASA